MKMNTFLTILDIVIILWYPLGCSGSPNKCRYSFEFLTLGKIRQITAVDNSTVKIPFRLVRENCNDRLDSITIGLYKHIKYPYCFFTHTNGNCEATDLQCRCAAVGDYALEKVVTTADSGRWLWVIHGITPPVRQEVVFNIFLPEPPQITRFTISDPDSAANSTVDLQCIVKKGTSPAEVRVVDGRNRTVRSCTTKATGSALSQIVECTLRHVQCEDSGGYTCQVEGATTAARYARLLVRGRPEISGPETHQRNETVLLAFRVCSYTDNLTECSLGQRPISTEDLQHGEHNSIVPLTRQCSRQNWSIVGEPPQLTLNLELDAVTWAKGDHWTMTLANAMGTNKVHFSKDTMTDQPKAFLQTDTGLITVISSGVVVLVIVTLVIGIVVRRRGRNVQRPMHDAAWNYHRRTLPRPPLEQTSPNQANQQAQLRLPWALRDAVAMSSIAGETRRSESSESDTYDKARDSNEHHSEGVSEARTRDAHTDSPPEDYLTPVTLPRGQVKGATNQPDDYLHPTA